ncbi:Lin1244/Lin1753 domain-containing protein [Bacteroides graminisolvens]|uniref:DUF7833 domain-containing protein n=1 Tax=Bacteroides graminisolvens TaxID=477666 RepID=UPI00240A0965|nr:Lin1244/Lin1753 domain-containing protein [Bacteroides graminisolvens]
MKNSQYFLHDCCARNNAKMLSLTADKGLEGYGAYWVLLEYLREQSDYYMPLSLLPSLAKQLGKFTQWVEEIVCNYGLFVLTDDGRFTSQGLQQRMKPLENKRKARDAKAEKEALKLAAQQAGNGTPPTAGRRTRGSSNPVRPVVAKPVGEADCFSETSEALPPTNETVQPTTHESVLPTEKTVPPTQKMMPEKPVNSNTNSSFSAAQKTETNEKNSAKNVENTPLQLLDNERVAKSSLEENSIVENSIEEIKRKEKEATASEKESSSSGRKSSSWEGWLNEALGERSWLELQAMHSGLGGAFLPYLEVISKTFREHVLRQGTEVTICSLRDVKSYFSNYIRQGSITNKHLREVIEKAAATNVYRFEQLVDGQRTYCGLPIPEGAPPRPAMTSVWDERKHCWEY